ncbi:hypothetical protein LSH36_184g12039 [Paralvinella palmiformis]|uniref:Uncharacterized protein n=1 Tax=Paralvinella palmiformis TaxID=53620 RepID=A0AAD9JR12_9ANNE|nr:hypothetical protein LSH36_184g12039 [Paralvinella palmiformis]
MYQTMTSVLLLPVVWFALILCGVFVTAIFFLIKKTKKPADQPYVLAHENLSLTRQNDADHGHVAELKYATKYDSAMTRVRQTTTRNIGQMFRRIHGVFGSREQTVDDARDLPENGRNILREALKDEHYKPEVVLMLSEVPDDLERY